ncbi:MAG: SsrA-binding protein SmpB [Bacteroidales bacterium]|jgi:SsrA-binding protein|nr:SsrA-binding protein SmpB [Bacteroidales bacterium]MCI1732936.1 SsrA-binding protein SmpB [Bacteroidales bacterium]
MQKTKSKIDIKNKKAGFEYEFLENYTAGIVLAGTEIKSIRAGKASLVDSYCFFDHGELYVKGMHIADYWWASYNRKDPKRDRKLLLKKKELKKLQRSVKEKGLTIVASRLFIADNGYAKLNISLARGKKEYDKRETIKQKDMRRAEQRGEDY